MKKLNSIAAFCLLLMACGQKQLSKSEAQKIITSQIHFPKVYTYPINTLDESVYHRLQNSSLTRDGFLVTPGFTLEDRLRHKPLVQLTANGKSYNVSDPDTTILLMKIAEEYFKEIKSVQMGTDGKSAAVLYISNYKNATPFAVIVPGGIPKETEHSVNLLLQDEGWLISK